MPEGQILEGELTAGLEEGPNGSQEEAEEHPGNRRAASAFLPRAPLSGTLRGGSSFRDPHWAMRAFPRLEIGSE